MITTPTTSAASFIALRPGFWRVVHPAGHVLGYIEEARAAGGHQFTARRLVSNTTRLVDIGDFWSLDSARACFA
ncbi:hypothetical protein [Agreia sp. Leaf210]|uniref:hypothetical protein n=1 Tax=Agreia sp. Leaf210 TaxID=1735682 RepID=UPI0006F3DE30|nr:MULTISPECIES: hypothetical protein [Microbacteriaceae]KQM60281.1 hypothetical protein ASE64_00840 [Agreia sp. Leaf210]PPF63305.1 hypothetical protein C5E11_07105 [Clavibacter michiganensis]